MALVESYTKTKIDDLLAEAKTTADADYAPITEPLAVAAQSAADAAQTAADIASPAGAMLMFGGAAAPTGWLMCDGAAVSRSTYADLFAAISTSFGVGDGSTTFNLPDMRGRVPVGVDGAAGRLSANDALGNSSGSETHTHTSPSHSHTHNTTHTHTHNATHTHTSPAHSHTLSAAGYAFFVFSTSAASMWQRVVTVSSYNAHRKATTGGTGVANSDALTTATELGGSTDSTSPGNTGASSPASTDASSPSNTDSTTPDPTGSTSTMQPYQVVNFIIKT